MPTVFKTVPGSGNTADKSDDILDPLPRKKKSIYRFAFNFRLLRIF